MFMMASEMVGATSQYGTNTNSHGRPFRTVATPPFRADILHAFAQYLRSRIRPRSAFVGLEAGSPSDTIGFPNV